MTPATHIRRLSVTCATVLGLVSTVCGQSISSVSPQAVRPGTTTDITLRGSGLAGATRLWMSFPGKAVLAAGVKNNGHDNGQVVFRVTVPANAPVGVHGLRVTTPAGVSGIRIVCVDDLPSVAQKSGNTTPAAAQPITLPVAVDGAVSNLGRHYFRFKATARQRLSIEILARRIGSPLDPIIRLLDANGRELAYSDDEPGLSGDAQLEYTFSQAGEYLVELRDINYRGGGNYTYRLRLGDFPCVTVPVPMAAHRGSEVALNFAGSHIDGLSPIRLRVPTDPLVKWVSVGAKRPGGKSSGFAVLAVSDRDQFLEAEPNNTARQANRVPLGSSLNGRLNTPGDEDRFVFTAAKGQRFVFTAVTRSQGAPSDLFISLYNTKGARIATSDDSGTSDSRLNYTFPAAGDYTLAVRDLNHRGGGAFAYHIAVKPYQPGFRLTASSDRLTIPAGGTAAVTVTAVRDGYSGPIALSISGLPPGVSSVPTVIGPGRNSAVLTVNATGKAVAGRMSALHVDGTAKIGTTRFRASSSVEPALKSAFAEMPYPPRVLLNSFAAAIGPPPPFSLRTEPAKLVFGRNLTAKVKIVATRRKGFDEAISLAVTPKKKGLPPGITVAIKPIPKGKNEIQLVFSASSKAPRGEFTAAFVASHKKGKTTTSQPVPGLGLAIEAPYQLSFRMGSVPLKVGGQSKIKVTVRRNPAFTAAIVLKIVNLPKGVTASAATIPAGKNEVDIVLSASKNTAKGAKGNVTVTGTSVIGKVKFSEKSPALPLTVR